MKSKESLLETVVHGIFLILGLITVGCVLLITVYLVISGVPAIAKIGLLQFLFGTKWASTASEPSFVKERMDAVPYKNHPLLFPQLPQHHLLIPSLQYPLLLLKMHIRLHQDCWKQL